MAEELDLAPDLASQQWWDDNWVQVAAGGSLSTPTLAYVLIQSPEDLKAEAPVADGGISRRASSSIMRPTIGDFTYNSARTRHSTGLGWKSTSSLPHPLTLTFADPPSRTMSTMHGKQYRFNLARSQPPTYWIIEKIHKYQHKMRNDLGQLIEVTRERLLEVFVIVDRKVMKCSTLYDLANVRIVRPRPSPPPSFRDERY